MECQFCGTTENLTIDHIIPRWLVKRLQYFGVKKPKPKTNYQVLCKKCNRNKGGMVDFNHPVAKELKEKLLKLLN